MQNNHFEDTLIAGGGPIGLACAISARRCGIDPLIVEAGAIADSIVRYPIAMGFFTTPELLEIGGHPFVCAGQKPTREEALKYYRGVVRTEGLNVRTYARLIGAERRDGRLVCRLTTAVGPKQISCDRLIIATGYFEHANLLNGPGEELPHVSHWFDEAHLSFGLDVVVVGGKNSAVETALQCFRAGGRVTLVYRGATLKPSVKFWLRPDLENRIAAGEIATRFGREVIEITPGHVVLQDGHGTVEHVPATRVYALTGYHPDFDLLAAVGVHCDAATGRPSLNPETLHTNVPGVYLAGSVGAGRNISEVFIENGRFDGEKIFGDAASRQHADQLYAESPRPVGE